MGNATVTVNGPGSTWNNAGSLTVGRKGIGEVNIEAGARVTSAGARIGVETGSQGTVNVDGPVSRWDIAGTLETLANGTLNITNGAVVTNDSGLIANQTNGVANITINGPGSSLLMTDNLFAANRPNAQVAIFVENGGQLTNAYALIGAGGATQATVTVDGPGANWTNGLLEIGRINSPTQVIIGNGGSVDAGGLLDIQPAGTVTLHPLGTLTVDRIAQNGGSFFFGGGTLNVTGTSGLTLHNQPGSVFPSQFIDVGKSLNVTHTTTIDDLRSLTVAGGSFSTGALTVNNGGFYELVSGVQNIHGPVTIETLGNVVTHGVLNVPIVGDGTLQTNGVLQVADMFAFTGVTIVHTNNILQIDNRAAKATLVGLVDLQADAVLTSLNQNHGIELSNTGGPGVLTTSISESARVDGRFTNNGSVSGPTTPGRFLTFTDNVNGAGLFNGNIEFLQGFGPGNSTASVPFGGNLLAGPNFRYDVEIQGLTPGTQHDQVVVANTATLDGTLNLILDTNTFVPTFGDTFDILLADQIVGNFDLFDGDVFRLEHLGLPDLALVPEVMTDIDAQGTDVVRVTTTGMGDANVDGRVTFADFAALQLNFGDTGVDWFGGDFTGDGRVTFADFSLLQLNFGDTFFTLPAPGSITLADVQLTIPEPTAASIFAGLGLLLAHRRQRHRDRRGG